MLWFFAFVIVALLGAVAVVATGRGGTLGEVYDDRPDSRVQAEGPLSSDDLARVRFSTALRGYRMSEVDALLDRLTSELEARETHVPAESNPHVDGHDPFPMQDRLLPHEIHGTHEAPEPTDHE